MENMEFVCFFYFFKNTNMDRRLAPLPPFNPQSYPQDLWIRITFYFLNKLEQKLQSEFKKWAYLCLKL